LVHHVIRTSGDSAFGHHALGQIAGAMWKRLLRMVDTLVVWVYRMCGGRWMGYFPPGASICLLATRGRKSGRRRTVPLLFLANGDDLVVVASRGGAAQRPGWYFNLVADPSAEVQVGRRRLTIMARTVSAEEKAALWPRLMAIYPRYEVYERRTARSLPLVRLSPDVKGWALAGKRSSRNPE
jgi:F420H(2)-dependent quinone reductase